MKRSDIQWDFLQDVALLIQFAKHEGFKLTGGELYRPQAMQDIYLARGYSQVSESQHQKRLAIDFNLFVGEKLQWDKNEHWEKLGAYWIVLNPDNRWGGDYKSLKDPYHFERLV